MNVWVSDLSIYRPSPENLQEMPKLEYVDSMFKRRLSQLSRMTIEAVHGVVEKNPEAVESKLFFSSFRGEISRQLKINRSLIEDADVMPAQFSISVFNTPPAVATIALKMKSGYTAVYPSEDDFKSAFLAASASVLCGSEKQIIFVYADEKVPEEYSDCRYMQKACSEAVSKPLAFACTLGLQKKDSGVEVGLDFPFHTPEEFVNFLEGKC